MAQERTGYLLGEEQGLEMIVHILGEVQKPGEYRISDKTDLLQLLSKAGGPTQFSRLSGVTVRREHDPRLSSTPARGSSFPVEILHVNLDKTMQSSKAMPPPLLKPGDVVLVPKNALHKWKEVSAIVRDISVVASAYFLYLRATRD
jgi:protein involved in polysaccharide export with SLBB domain